MKLFRVLIAFGLIFAAAPPSGHAAPTTNGLYAVFNTSKGIFYCILRYDLTPRTVANFVGLAEGTKSWVDYPHAAVVQRPFYNGLTFHRVIAGFVIQSGSPNGSGTDDPGYKFKDEITNALTHANPGVLAMANTGTNTDGAQFYATVAPEPSLDGHYTIFGQVVEGMNVVSNINSVATDFNDTPLVPVILTNVTILRIGTAASNFNAAAVTPALPNPRGVLSHIGYPGQRLTDTWDWLTNHEYRLFYSVDLKTWSWVPAGTAASAHLDTTVQHVPTQFFLTIESNID